MQFENITNNNIVMKLPDLWNDSGPDFLKIF